MPATIFAGTRVKALKSTLNLNGGADIISSSVDPTSSTTEGEPGSLLLNTTSGKLYRKNDSGSSTNWSEVGSGGSGINYVTNPSAATNTTGWSTYADAAGAQPVDGTGGSPTVTWTRSTTTPLRGAGDFNFTKDAANRQGEGVATDITIDLADQAKVLTVSFDYEVLSGTYATGDLTVYLIADPSGTPVVIQPAGYQVQSGTAGTKLKQIATFQTQATGQSYRVCFHVASTSASAYSLAIDNVVVGPQTVQYGAPVTDWVDFTPSVTNFTTSSLGGKWRRVGDTVQVRVRAVIATISGSITVGCPTGLNVDSSKLPPSGTVNTLFNSAFLFDTSTGNGYSGGAFILSPASTPPQLLFYGPSGGIWSTTTPFAVAAGDILSFDFEYPVLGWSSTVQMSNDVSTRAVEFSVSQSTGATTTISSTPTKIANLNSVLLDTLNGWNVANSRYVIPVPGVYTIKASLFIPTSPSPRVILGILKNGAQAGPASTTYALGTLQCEVKLQCVAGDYIEIYGQLESGTLAVGGFSTTNFSVALSQGPSAIAATESVTGKYENTAGTALTGNVEATLPFATKKYDSHGAFNGTVFTAPISGVYQFSSTVSLQAVANTTNQVLAAGFRVTSTPEGISALREYVMVEWGNGVSHGQVVTFTKSYKLNAGDTVEVRALNTNSVSLATDAGVTFFCWNRVGN